MSKPSEETKRKYLNLLKDEWFCILIYIEKGGGYIG